MPSLGSTPGIIVGVGVGAAASSALEPVVEPARQAAWANSATKLLDVSLLARLIAQGGVPLDKSAYNEAARDGFANDKLDALVYLALSVPGVPEALDLWRKGLITEEDWNHALRKSALDTRYWSNPAIKGGGLAGLKTAELLGLGDIDYAVVRGLMPDEGLLPVAPPVNAGILKRFPQSTLNPIDEAAKLGYSEELLRIMIGRSGLAMAPVAAANAYFRGDIELNDFYLAIAEGDLRNEYRDAILAVSRQILTPGQYSEAELRGYSTTKERLANTAKHGMSQGDSDLLHLIQGRPVAVHQVTTGLARGGTYPSLYTDVPEPYQAAIRESDIKEPWASIAFHNRYTYPSGFQIKAETQNGDLAQADAEEILLEIGWAPKWATFFSTAWAKPKATSSASHVSKAQTQLWGALHKSYLDHFVPTADAEATLTAIGVPATQQADVLRLWNVERDLTRKALTAKQIVKAPATDPVYGTEDQKLQALQHLGYSLVEAQTLIAEG